MLLVKKEKVSVVLKDRGPNDLEWIIERLKKENYKLEMEVEMLKKDIAFLREEIQATNLKNIIKCKVEM